jgi:hypothetical protein
VLQEWLQRRAAKDAARAAAKAWRNQWAALQRALGQLGTARITGGASRVAGTLMPDLLQFSGTGGLGSLYGTSEASFGLGDALLGLGSLAIQAFAPQQQSVLAPYGNPPGPNIFYSTAEQANAAITQSLAGGCGSPFVAGGSALRPSIFSMANPASGKLTWFRPAGRPVLWSSDLGACRRVARIARKAKRRSGGR